MGENTSQTNRMKILEILKSTYPKASIALVYENPWELLVSIILSAQCTDIMVKKVTPALFQKFPNVESFANAKIGDIEQMIKPTGFYHAKAKSIQETARLLIANFDGKVPRSMKDMLTLRGVARKTANVVLGNAYTIVEGIAVDTHVLRISQRLRLIDLSLISPKQPIYIKHSFETSVSRHAGPDRVDGDLLNEMKLVFQSIPQSDASIMPAVGGPAPTVNGVILIRQPTEKDLVHSIIDYYKSPDPVKVEAELMKAIPRSDWFSITYRIIDHGRAICKAINPKCTICPLKSYCPVSR